MAFELPDNLGSFSTEDLDNLIAEARDEFNTLNESDDISDETLDRMSELADGIDGVSAEKTRRVEAAAKRVELSAKVNPVEEVAEVEASIEAEAEVELSSDEETEVEDEEAGVELAVEDEVVVDEEDDAEEFSAESDDVDDTEITSEETTLVAAAKNPIAVPENNSPLVVITAAVDVPQFYVGQQLDPVTLADALHNKARMLSDSRGAQTIYPFASIERPFHPEYDLEGLDQSTAWDRIAEGTKPSALTAAGGWCAPSQIVYDLFETECTTDNLYSLPTFKVTRGGMRWPVFVPHDETLNPGFVWTEADDIAATSGTPTKPCVRIPCPTFTECRLDATGLCITAGNLMDRAYPEQIRWFINRAVRAYERNSAARQLNLVLADTVPVVLAATFGAASAVVSALLLQAADFRQKNGMCVNETVEVVAPSWLSGELKADIARQQGFFTELGSLPTDADVAGWFSGVGISIKYIDHWQLFPVNPQLTWPASVQVLVGYPGSYVRFDGGRLDLGVIRDSVLNATNDYTAVWFEEFYCVGRRGPQSRLVTIPLCPLGEVGGRNPSAGEAVCPTA